MLRALPFLASALVFAAGCAGGPSVLAEPPRVAPIAPVSLPVDGSITVPIAISAGGRPSAASWIAAEWDNADLLPPGSLLVSNSPAHAPHVSIRPARGLSGRALIVITVADRHEATSRTTFEFRVE